MLVSYQLSFDSIGADGLNFPHAGADDPYPELSGYLYLG